MPILPYEVLEDFIETLTLDKQPCGAGLPVIIAELEQAFA